MVDIASVEDYLRTRIGQRNIWFMESCATGSCAADDYNDTMLENMQYILGASDHAYGATKAVFFFNTPLLEDWVVKIPYHGWFDPDPDYSMEEMQEAAEEYEEFTGAEGPHREWDYCDREAEVFQLSLNCGMDEFFAATYYVCTIQDIPFYVSEKICYNEFNSDEDYLISDVPYHQLKTTARAIASKYHVFDMPIEDIIPTLVYGGQEIVEQLFGFCRKYRVNDLHSANYTVLPDGFLKIFDYSGYHE